MGVDDFVDVGLMRLDYGMRKDVGQYRKSLLSVKDPLIG
jgi:hypothetical protein